MPGNRVIALVDDAETGSAVRDDLAAAGLEEATLVTGIDERLEVEDSTLIRTLQRLNSGTEETRYLDKYEEAVRQGQTLVAVRATGHNEVRRAKQIMQRHGAMDIRYFGRLGVSELATGGRAFAGRGEKPQSWPGGQS
jgi:hypothetical protein